MSELQDWFVEEIPEAIRRDAERWMVLLDSERCGEAERLAFARWLEEDPRRRWAFEELSTVWAKLHMLSALPSLKREAGVVELFSPPRLPSRPVAARPFRASDRATVTAACLVGLGLVFHWIGGDWGG